MRVLFAGMAYPTSTFILHRCPHGVHTSHSSSEVLLYPERGELGHKEDSGEEEGGHLLLKGVIPSSHVTFTYDLGDRMKLGNYS